MSGSSYLNVRTLKGRSEILRYYELENLESLDFLELSYSNPIAAALLDVVSLLEQISTISGRCHVATDLTETFFYIPIKKKD